MRKLAPAAVLVALATPAWAANGEKPRYKVTNPAAFDVCKGSGTPSAICAMKYVAEADAPEMAQANLALCLDDTSADCVAVRAYIKQRWGY
jgi:hypothetical protein